MNHPYSYAVIFTYIFFENEGRCFFATVYADNQEHAVRKIRIENNNSAGGAIDILATIKIKYK